MATRRCHVMAGPAGSTCNLDCTCRYYLSKRELPGGPGSGYMSHEVLAHDVRDYIDSVTADEKDNPVDRSRLRPSRPLTVYDVALVHGQRVMLQGAIFSTSPTPAVTP
jgi:hypothetical protein